MPYISKEDSREIRKKLKEEFKGYKFSVTIEHGSSLNVAVLEAPLKVEDGESINHYWYKTHYKDREDILSFVEKIMALINSVKVHKTINRDADYGNIPSYYLHIEFGKYGKEFKSTLEEK